MSARLRGRFRAGPPAHAGPYPAEHGVSAFDCTVNVDGTDYGPFTLPWAGGELLDTMGLLGFPPVSAYAPPLGPDADGPYGAGPYAATSDVRWKNILVGLAGFGSGDLFAPVISGAASSLIPPFDDTEPGPTDDGWLYGYGVLQPVSDYLSLANAGPSASVPGDGSFLWAFKTFSEGGVTGCLYLECDYYHTTRADDPYAASTVLILGAWPAAVGVNGAVALRTDGDTAVIVDGMDPDDTVIDLVDLTTGWHTIKMELCPKTGPRLTHSFRAA